MTMLTLFKPWRSGKDLKLEAKSWDKTFTKHKFINRQLEIINHFNLRYECLNAKDDFSAQLRKGTLLDQGICPKFMTLDMIADLDDDNLCNDDNFSGDESFESDDTEYNLNVYSQLGSHGRLIKAQMDATENIVRNVDWLNKCLDGTIEINTESLEIDISQTPSQWKVIVQHKRQELMAEQNEYALKKSRSQHPTYIDSNENDIMIIDQSYLTKEFRAENQHVTRSSIY